MNKEMKTGRMFVLFELGRSKTQLLHVKMKITVRLPYLIVRFGRNELKNQMKRILRISLRILMNCIYIFNSYRWMF